MVDTPTVIDPAAPPAGDPPATYYAGYDDETKGWLNNRGMDKLPADEALAAAIKGHRSAEQSLGVPQERRLDLPADQNAPGAMDGIYNRLGRPEAAEGYEFTGSEADGSDKAFDDWAKDKFHAAGIGKSQADALYTEFKTFIGDTVGQSTADAATQAAADLVDLQREWGPTAERNLNVAKAAAAKFGLDEAKFASVIAALPKNEGYKLFQAIGAGLGEDPFVNPLDTTSNGATTPEGARTEIAALKKDKAWVEKYQKGDVTARAQSDRLHKIAFGQ